jgi:uncharacterized membrane protein
MTAVAPKDSVSTDSNYAWFLGLAIMAAFNLYAFWVLLGSSYFPEYYKATPDFVGPLEITWMMMCCAAVVIGLAWLRHRPDQWRRLMWNGLLVTTASCLIVAKQFLGIAPQCLDPILFSTSLGWTLALSSWGPEMSNSGHGGSAQFGGENHEWNSERLLAVGVVTAAVGLFAYFLAQQIHYYNALELGYADCGDYARIMYNTIHNPRELFMRVNPDRPLFFDHFQPGFLPFVLLWLLWPSIQVTSLLQVFSLVGCALPIYWIGKQLFRDQTAASLLAAVWLAYPSVSQFIYCDGYGFHCGSLCLPLYFLALAAWVKDRRGWALFVAIWAVLIKEEAAIPIGMFGIYLTVFEKRYRIGAAIAGISFAYFFLMTTLVIPMFDHHPYLAQGHFAHLGATKWEILLSPWKRPREFWGNLLGPSTFYFGALLLGPLLFVPVKRSAILLAGSLVFLFDCLHPTLKSICYSYQAGLLPIVIWAFAAALQATEPMRRRAIIGGALAATIVYSLFFGNAFWSKTTLTSHPQPSARLQTVLRVGRDIDPRGSLFATQRAAAHFVTQRHLYLDLPVPADTDYVLLDMRNSWKLSGISWFRDIRDMQRQAEAMPNMHLTTAEDGVVLYSREGKSLDAQGLVERDTLPAEAVLQSVSLGRGVHIVGYVTSVAPPERTGEPDQMRVRTFSSVEAPVATDLAVRCVLKTDTDNVYARAFASEFQLLGQGIWPIPRWVPGKFYEDDFLVAMPAGRAAGGYALKFEVLAVAP